MATSSSPKSIAASRTLQVARTAGGGGGNINLPAANLVIDTFETANMQPTLNNVGFSWAVNNQTSIVTMNPGPTVVWNNGVISKPGSTGTDWSAKEGAHSLRFGWNPGENNAEQRWGITTGQPELWTRFWFKVVEGFYYPDNGINCKFHALWSDGYETAGTGSTIIYQLRPNSAVAGGARLVCAVTNPWPNGTMVQTGEDPLIADFIDPVRDAGRWMQVVMRVKASSTHSAQDGIIQSWRRWEDESAFTLMQNQQTEYTGLPAGEAGYRNAFIFGYMNAPGYSQFTEFLLDNYELSDQPLVPAGTEGL
jgi:hypothetical protein